MVSEDLVEAPLMLKVTSPIILMDGLAYQVVMVVWVSKDHEVWMDRGVRMGDLPPLEASSGWFIVLKVLYSFKVPLDMMPR